MKKITCMFIMMILMASAVLTACNSVSNETPQTDATEPADDSQDDNQSADDSLSSSTITITDIRGDVEIPANPQRIVDISGCSDILYILGYQVIGTANSDAYDYTKLPDYLEEALAGTAILGYFYQDTMDVEAIIALEPDLIIMSAVQEKMYEQLSIVAPTVMIELAQIDWTEDLMNIAKIMQKEDIAAEWLEAYMEKAEAAGKRIEEVMGEDTSYGSFLASGGSIFVFSGTGIGAILYDDMGLARPQGMPEQENVSLPVITYEGLAEIEADYMFVVGTDEDLDSLKANSIWNSLPFVQEENYLELPANVYFGIGYSAVGRMMFLDEVEALIDSMKLEKR